MQSFTLTLIAFCGTAFGQSTYTPQLTLERIGVNDVLAISVNGAAAMPQSLRVAGDGGVQLPMLAQPVKAAGLLPKELEGEIARALKSAAVVANPRVTVAVSEFHSRPVSVIGAVNHPALFQASGDVTLREALERAEGLSPEAGGEILLRRPRFDGQSVPVQRIPVKALLDNSDPALNLVLSGGEDIRVPEALRIFVGGNVTRPGLYKVSEGEATALNILASADGIAPNAHRQAFIYRRDGSGSKREIAIELKKIMQHKAPDVTLRAGDILYVPDARGGRMKLSALEKTVLAGETTALATMR